MCVFSFLFRGPMSSREKLLSCSCFFTLPSSSDLTIPPKSVWFDETLLCLRFCNCKEYTICFAGATVLDLQQKSRQKFAKYLCAKLNDTAKLLSPVLPAGTDRRVGASASSAPRRSAHLTAWQRGTRRWTVLVLAQLSPHLFRMTWAARIKQSTWPTGNSWRQKGPG